jgi:hypothetical protein
MELLAILNHCLRHRGFVYQHSLGPDKKSIEVDVRPRERSTALCSGCHQPAPGYDHLPERYFEFIPLSGFLVFLLYRMRRVECRNCAWWSKKFPGVMTMTMRWGWLSKPSQKAGPYVRRHAVVSRRNTTVNVVKTIEAILGVGPLGLNDALATRCPTYSIRPPTLGRTKQSFPSCCAPPSSPCPKRITTRTPSRGIQPRIGLRPWPVRTFQVQTASSR